jgi:hypothetical protein
MNMMDVKVTTVEWLCGLKTKVRVNWYFSEQSISINSVKTAVFRMELFHFRIENGDELNILK